MYCRLLPQSHAPSTSYIISAVGLSALERFFKKLRILRIEPRISAKRRSQTQRSTELLTCSTSGLEDEVDISEDSNKIAHQQHSTTDDDGVDAWGWGDENDDKPSSDVSMLTGPPIDHLSGQTARSSSPRREVILKENYTVTDIPDSVLSILLALVSDAESLVNTE